MAADSSRPATRKRRILPPVYFFAALAAMLALDRFAPLAKPIEPPFTHLGWALFALGAAAVLVAKRQFDRAETTIKPFETSAALVTHGLFARSRNPIYLGMVVALLGICMVLGSLSPLVAIPVFVAVIRTRVIAVEEVMLEETFGDDYRAYKGRVRRWL